VAAPPAAAGVAAAAAAATGGAGAAAQVGSTAQSLLTALREIGVDEGEAHHAAQHAVPLDLGALLGQALTAALAPRPAAAARSSHEGANRSGLASSHAVDGGQHGEQQVLSEGAGNREEDGNSDEDDDEVRHSRCCCCCTCAVSGAGSSTPSVHTNSHSHGLQSAQPRHLTQHCSLAGPVCATPPMPVLMPHSMRTMMTRRRRRRKKMSGLRPPRQRCRRSWSRH
jgi:hypothetical protein